MKNLSTKPKQFQPDKERKQLDGYARYTNLAFQMFAIIGVGIFAGVKLDQWLHLKFPIFTVIFSILSVSAAIYSAIKDLLRK
jgi:hypothetical protein